MIVQVQDRKVLIEIPFEEITHVYSDPIGEKTETGETELGFGIEVHDSPFIDLKLMIQDGKFATEIMQELGKEPSNVRIG